MPFYDLEAQNAALDALWGSQHASTMPDSFEVALFDADPSEDGAELESDGGYGRVTCLNTNAVWLPADQGIKSTVPIAFPDPTDEWSSDAAYWGIYVGGVLWDYGPLADLLTVEGPSDGPRITITRYFDAQTIEE